MARTVPSGELRAIMLGSTETTFYTISVYFGAAGVRRTRYAVPAALLADHTGFCMVFPHRPVVFLKFSLYFSPRIWYSERYENSK